MRRLSSLLILFLLAACATDETPRPAVVALRPDPCAGIQADGLVDPRESRFLGCANAVNLRLMVADPRDLKRGKETTQAHDGPVIDAARRHRLGKVSGLGAEVSGESYGASKSGAN